MTAKLVALLGRSRRRAFGDQINIVRSVSGSETFQPSLAVDVFDPNPGPMFTGALMALLVDISPQPERKASRKTAPRRLEVICKTGQVKGEIESDQEAAALIDCLIKLFQELTAG